MIASRHFSWLPLSTTAPIVTDHTSASMSRTAFVLAAAAAAAAAGVGASAVCEPAEAELFGSVGVLQPSLPEISLKDVALHKPATTPDGRLWVTFKDGVYDITEFVVRHPGGDKILLASGGPLEPFWALYGVHKSSSQAAALLEQLRIGNVATEDRRARALQPVVVPGDPFASDPSRHPALRVLAPKPFNAEVPPQLLTDSFITPNDLFFVRNHLPVPVIDAECYRLVVEGPRPLSLSLSQLRALPQRTITASVQCGGNRRSEMNSAGAVRGLDWRTGAISTATWTGVWLRDLLALAGVHTHTPGVTHVQFEGSDCDEAGKNFGASIPASKALFDGGDVLVALEMNGQPVPRDHGYPVRLIVPGHVGSRNVKWLRRIIPSDSESQAFWQQHDYKVLGPWVTWETAAAAMAVTPAMQSMPVTSAITVPAPGSSVDLSCGSVDVGGYAYSGGGVGIQRVDVSVDGGRTWHPADLDHGPVEGSSVEGSSVSDSSTGRRWAWSLWSARVPVPETPASGTVEVLAKAVDRSGNTQPEHVSSIWNIRGLCNNSAPRLVIKHKADAE